MIKNFNLTGEIQNILCDMVIDIHKLLDEAQNTKVNITIKNASNIAKFNERIISIFNYVNSMYKEFTVTGNYEATISHMMYLYSYINENYNYKEGTYPYKSINSIKDVIDSAWGDLSNSIKNYYNY